MLTYQRYVFLILLSCPITSIYSFTPVTIGFNQTTYSVREDAGSVTVSVSVISGTISEDVIITLSTALGGSATGGIVVLRSTAASIPQQELPYSLIKYHGYYFCCVSHLIEQIWYPFKTHCTL